jgi:hypothetical protein
MLASAAVAAFFWLRKHLNRRWPAVVLCLLGYCAANFGIYVFALSVAAEERRKERESYERKHYRPQPSATSPVGK